MNYKGCMKIARALTLLALVVSTLTIVASPANASTSPITAEWTEPQAGYGFLDAAVASAHHRVELSMYELEDPTMVAALDAAARRGVSVSVILNSAYSGRTHNASAAATLSAHGVHVTWAPGNQIFHAKYLVVDTRAYIGTGNFVPQDYADTRDYWIEDTTASDVNAIAATFSGDVAGNTTSSSSSGGLVWSPGSESTLESFILTARHSVLIENEEMYSYGIEDAIAAAAARGVAVTVVMTRDSKYYSDLSWLASRHVHVRLLSSGQIYIHAKAMCVDCVASRGTVFVGSINFSNSSTNYNRELGVITSSPIVVGAVRATIAADATLGVPYA